MDFCFIFLNKFCGVLTRFITNSFNLNTNIQFNGLPLGHLSNIQITMITNIYNIHAYVQQYPELLKQETMSRRNTVNSAQFISLQ